MTHHRLSRTLETATIPLRLLVVLGMLLGMLGVLAPASPAAAASVMSASFSGGAGTVSVGGTLYAKQGAALTLTVNTDANTKCVRVTDGTTSIDKDSSTAQTTWNFSSADSAALFVAGSSNGVKSVTATAFRNSNGQHKCTANQGEQFGTQTASYVLDNTGPVVTGTVSPAANAAGWNNSAVTVTWSAVDAGAGVASITPPTSGVTADTAGMTVSATATDNLGNTGTSSVTVKLDTTKPTITGAQMPAANANGWNNSNVTVSFTCSDALSGISVCAPSQAVTTEGANQSVTGTATDNAGNSASTTVTGINVDKTAPTLSGAPTAQPNANGWYNGDVTIHWTAADGLSGIDPATQPADSAIGGEGAGLTASATVKDKAGNQTTATSAPVKIDRTAPTTSVSAPPAWNNTDVTLNLSATDNLSGVAATYYILDGGSQQTGTSVVISAEGMHTLAFWSVDKAGNVEATKTVQVNIDKTPPTIAPSLSPAPNGAGWNNGDVTVTFTCADSLSGVASCTGPQAVTAEGKGQDVIGAATDNAGNTATAHATVNIDKTPPTISGAPDRAPNANGWYNGDVTVTFSCGDALSGVADCATPVTLGEGVNQAANGSVADNAGNTAGTTVAGINVDKTPPTLSGAATTAPNADGWYRGDVTVHWTCADALSGVDGACPADSTVTGEGANLSASAQVSDKAGNTTTATVAGIKIDRTAPSTLVSPDRAPMASGWYASAVTVTLNAVDSLSGVAATYYRVDGGDPQTYNGPFSFGQGGIHTITFWSADNAGNTEDQQAPGHTITIQIDNIPPTIAGSSTPPANANGWNNTAVAVSFNCNDAESGVATCTGATTLGEGANQSVAGTATDNAGNSASTTVSGINIDLTAPTITGAADRAPNAAGWYNGDVTVTFSCGDALSGVASCAQPVTLSAEGAGQSVAGQATDKADNSAGTTVGGINIDKTAPTIVATATTADGKPYPPGAWTNQDVTVSFRCADTLSGIPAGTCPTPVVVNANTPAAGQGVSASVADAAGNTATSTPLVVKVDKTAPTTTAAAPASWTNQDVTVALSASDDLSGVAGTYYTVDGGAQQTGTSVAVTAEGVHTIAYWSVDNAGNTEAAHTVTVKLDKTAPTISGERTASNANGWNNGDVTVTFTCADPKAANGADGSGIASCTAPVTLTNEGAGQSVAGQAQDNAGNTASVTVGGINIDKTAPTTTATAKTADGKPYTSGTWANQAVTVTFACDDALSGVATCPAPVTVNADTTADGQTVSGVATDMAGNSAASNAIVVKVDQTPPTIALVSQTPANANGWNNGSVTVTWNCADALSGVSSPTVSQTLSGDGASQSVTGICTDAAGNTASNTVTGINIDTKAPTLNPSLSPNPVLLNGSATASANATDTLSGIASQGCTAADTTSVGTKPMTCTATDKAGNTASAPVSYTVQYATTGTCLGAPGRTVLQPINPDGTSVFKLGSTVPVKFRVCDANGVSIGTPGVVTSFKLVGTSANPSATLNEDPGSTTPDTAFRWDATNQQWIFNLSTKNLVSGTKYTYTIALNDGTSFSFSFTTK